MNTPIINNDGYAVLDNVVGLVAARNQAVDKALRSPNRRVDFRYELLSRFDRPLGDVDGIISASVSHDMDRAVMRAANFQIHGSYAREINFLTERIRPWMVLHMPDGTKEEFPLGIFLLESPGIITTDTAKIYDVGGFDKSLMITQFALTQRLFFAEGTPYMAAVTQVINMAGIVDARVQHSDAELPADMEFPIGTTAYDVVESLSVGANYDKLSTNGIGTVIVDLYSPPIIRQATLFYSSVDNSIVAPQVTENMDIATLPNVFIRLAENIDLPEARISVLTNDNPNHPLSTVRRGRSIMDFARINEPVTQAALDAYVHRRAVETLSSYRYIDFETLLMPVHDSSEILYLDLVQEDVTDTPVKLHETSWSMDLRPGGMMSHRGKMMVEI